MSDKLRFLEDTFRLLIPPDGVFEIRALAGREKRGGYFDFDHIPEAIKAALQLSESKSFDGSPFNVYWTLNPVNRDCLSRAANRVVSVGKDFPLTRDSEIIKRFNLLIDCDPVRTAGVSSTDQEKEAAKATAKGVYDELESRGFSRPLVADSGNGLHLIYRIDAPNIDATTETVKRFLKALAKRHDSPAATVDTSVFNPSRISAAYGTMKRKGDSTESRPHRRTRPLITPGEMTPVPFELIEAIAAEVPDDRPQRPVRIERRGGKPVESLARAYLLNVDPAISGQHGHDKTFWAACQLVQGFDLTPDQAFPLLCEYNSGLDEQWTEEQLRHKLDGAEARSGDRGYLLGWTLHPPKHANEFELFSLQTPSERELDDALAGIGIDESGASGTGAEPKATPVREPIRNFSIEQGPDEKKARLVPLPMTVIADRILTQTKGYPKRVSDCLFFPNLSTDGVQWIQETDSLMGVLGEVTGFPPEFIGNSDGRHVHTKGEVFRYMKRVAEQFEAVETLPHEPLMAGHYYACDIPSSGDGSALRELVSRFCPETDVDRDLILAAFVTPFWGGAGGTRPAFCITSDDGRGSGKSTLANAIADLAGGSVEIASNEDIQQIKTRLLSSAGQSKRVLLLDNMKSLKFSCAELEALITSDTISGRKLYEGEGSRPNTLTVILTANGASLSMDMAQRSVFIKLKRPEYSGTWEDEVREFITSHRQQLVADALGFLRQPNPSLGTFNRWGAWQQSVLSRLPEPSEAAAVIKERESTADSDTQEAGLIEDFFASRLEAIGYTPDTEKVFIPSQHAYTWLREATGDRQLTVTRGMTLLRQKIKEGSFKYLAETSDRSRGRGIEWIGKDSTGTEIRRDLPHQIEINKIRSTSHFNSFE